MAQVSPITLPTVPAFVVAFMEPTLTCPVVREQFGKHSGEYLACTGHKGRHGP